MNGYLDKTMLLSLLRQNAEEARIEADEFGGECVAYAECLEDVVSDVEHFPTIDAVPVVRCRDCIYGEIDDPDFPDQFQCKYGCGWNKSNFFCSYGERMEG